MKKYLLILFVAVSGLYSCSKNDDSSSTYVDPTVQLAADEVKIQAYLKTNNITTALKDTTGVYYQVVKPGTGAYPSSTATISVNYTGKLLNGTTFDSGTLTSQPLTGLIPGWRIGVPYINTGGQIILYIPSGYGYGSVTQGPIPANSVLIFTIDLLGFK